MRSRNPDFMKRSTSENRIGEVVNTEIYQISKWPKREVRAAGWHVFQ